MCSCFIEFINELGKRDTMGGLSSMLSLFLQGVHESTNVRFYLSCDIKITLKSHYCRKKRYNFVMYATSLWTS